MPPVSMVQKIRSQIESDIQSGKYHTGQKLPTERELSERFKVSHMTVRRALADLVDKQIIVSRPREGMYVGKTQELTDTRQSVTIIACDCKSLYIQDEISAVGELFVKKGWRTDLVRISGQGLQQAAKIILEKPTIILDDQIFFDSPISRAVDQTEQPVILVGGKSLGSRKIPHIGGDDQSGLVAVLELMEQLNPERVATLWATRLEDYPEPPVLGAFKAMGNRFGSIQSIFALTPPFASETEKAYEVTQQHLKRHEAPTVMFCSSDECAIGAMAAVRDAGLRIPEDISIIAYGDSCLCKYASPSVTAVNMDFQAYAHHAETLMRAMCRDKNYRPAPEILVKPYIVARQSTLAGKTALSTT